MGNDSITTMPFVYSKSSGFTLIELMVVMALLVGISTTLSLNAKASRDVTNIDAAAQQIVSTVRYAEALGKSGTVFGTGPTQNDRGYGVYMADDTSTLIIYGGDNIGPAPLHNTYDAGGALSRDQQRVETQVLPRGVTITDICVKNTQTCTSGDSSEAHIHLRRGSTVAHLHKNSTTATASYVGIILRAGTEVRTVWVVSTGLVYVQ